MNEIFNIEIFRRKKNVETKMLFSCLEIIDELKINFSPPKKKNYQSIN